MGWNKAQQAKPGQVSESGRESQIVESPDNMAYPGFVPQMYMRPVMDDTVNQIDYMGGCASAVPNNTLRGTESHGVQVDSHVGPRDSVDAVGDLTEKSDWLPQNMPEKADTVEYEPIKVQITNQDPDQIIRVTTNTVNITPAPATLTGQGRDVATGITPIRILGKDPRRTRAYVYVVSFTSGGNAANGVASQAVLLSAENQPPTYGFPLGSTRMEVLATDEVWVCGQNVGDAGIIAVYAERAINADRLYGD